MILKVALKIMPPILLCCSSMSASDVSGMIAEVELSHYELMIFSFFFTLLHKWQLNSSQLKIVYDMKESNDRPAFMWKKKLHLHLGSG